MNKQEDAIKISKVTLWQIISFVFFVLFVISILTGGFGGTTTNKLAGKANVKNANPTPSAAVNNPVNINLEGAHIRGDENAPVTMVEWSDFQCPFCGRFYVETEKQLVEEYVNTGKVKLIYKQFPLEQLHPFAKPAALASECAAEQGKFWEYHDKVFENQQSLNGENLKKWAGEIGLNQAQFDSCLDDQKYLDKVNADLAEGSSAGIRGTPGFLIDGQLISGAQPYSVFKSAIEAALN